jgi:integrase
MKLGTSFIVFRLNLAAGENISWVSSMLGHSSADITWKRYNRFIPNLTRADGSAFEKAFQNSTNEVTEGSNLLKL